MSQISKCFVWMNFGKLQQDGLRCFPDFNVFFWVGVVDLRLCQALWLPHPWWWLSSTCCCRVSGGPSRTCQFEFWALKAWSVWSRFGLQVLIAMAKFERSLSNNDLNKSMMQKIFLAQTLNIGTLDQFGNLGSGCLDEPGAALHVMYRS